MRASGGTEIDDYLHSLGGRLRGPRRLKADLLTEARHALVDAAAGYRADGRPAVEAERLAVAEFGSVPRLAGAYQAELAASTTRSLALRVLVVWLVLLAGADLTWRGAPWTGPRPPSAYVLLSSSLSWLWAGCGLVAIAGYAWLTWVARRGQPATVRANRVIGWVIAGSLASGSLAGIVLFGWSFVLWESARTWPPMIVGAVVVAAAYAWLGATAGACLGAVRTAPPAPGPPRGTVRRSS